MALDTSKVNQKIPISSGIQLFQEGEEAQSLNLLHEGGIKFIKNVNGKNFTIFQLNGSNYTPGAISLFTDGMYPFTIQTTENSVVSTYLINKDSIGKTIVSKLTIGLTIARSFLRSVQVISKRIQDLKSFSASIEKLNDNLSVCFYLLNPSSFPDITPDNPGGNPDLIFDDPSLRLCRENISSFILNGGDIPSRLGPKFLKEDLSHVLQKEYNSEYEFNDKRYELIKRIFSVDANIQNSLFQADPTLLLNCCEALSEIFMDLYRSAIEVMESANIHVQNLCSTETSLIEKYFMLVDVLNSTGGGDKDALISLSEYVLPYIQTYLNQYKSLFYEEFINPSPNIAALDILIKNFRSDMGPIAPEKSSTSDESFDAVSAGIDMDALKKEMENSSSKIFNFAQVPVDTTKEYSALIAKLKTLPNPLDPDPDIRKIRRNLTKIYWDVYQKSINKYMVNKNVPKQIEMMLKYGYFDETLLEPDQVAFLYMDSSEREPSTSIPVYEGLEWLEMIQQKKYTTSLDEMGQTFFEKLKMETKDFSFKKESELPPNLDNGTARLKYEMSAMFEPNVKLTSGSPASHLPILTKYHIMQPLNKCKITKEGLNEIIQEILKADFSAFNREIVYKNDDLGIKSEFVQTSVIPDFILVPSIGNKVMMWQHLSLFRGFGSKESRGRIILPRFATGDFKTMVMESIAVFRWELCKEILGPDWNNVGIPSITSEYTDYVQFFKKNRDLSIEVKEKLAAEFKRFRDDRSKFVNDYILWIKYESDGIQRLNKVVRNMFYKHIPFPKDIREKVSKLPAFIEIHNRFVNIRNRVHKEMENRYKKYSNQNGSLPKILQENIDYYSV